MNSHNYHAHTLLATARNEIDMGVHMYNQMTLNSEWAEGEMTFTLTRTCLLVPWQHEVYINQVMRYSQSCTIFLLLTLLTFYSICWKLCCQNGWRGFYIALAVFYNQPLDDKFFHSLRAAYKFFHLSVILSIFIMWNIRNAYLSSIMSTNHHGPQINTVQDFLQTPLRIMLTDTEVAMYFTPGLLPEELKERLVVVSFETLIEHIQGRNTSFAYCVTSSQWQMSKMIQRAMAHELFRRAAPQLCTPQYVKLFPVQRNSPFRSHFQIFYNAVRSYGFDKKWEDDSFMMARHMGLIRIYLHNETSSSPLTLYDLRRVFGIYLILNAFALFCLLCEISCKEWGDLVMKHMKRTFCF